VSLSLTSFYVGFRDQELMKKFDKALTEMKNDGTYNKIIESYVAE
jgi:ABC-type amino acid transport substrate-binding protein